LINVLNPVLPSISSKLGVLKMTEKTESKVEAANVDNKQGIKMETNVLDCPVCFEPLNPPILQVGRYKC
jgi:hypothetical protein